MSEYAELDAAILQVFKTYRGQEVTRTELMGDASVRRLVNADYVPYAYKKINARLRVMRRSGVVECAGVFGWKLKEPHK